MALHGVVGAAAVTGIQRLEGHWGVAVAWADSDAIGGWGLALGLHLLLGAAFGVVYGWAFSRMRRAGWGIGMLLGAVHGALALAALLWLPFANLLPWFSPEPLSFGWFVGLHLFYGAIVGALGKLAVDPEARAVLEHTRTAHHHAASH